MKRPALMLLLCVSPAYGQTAAQVTDALASIRTHDQLLTAAFQNLQGMNMGPEGEVLRSASDAINFMRASDDAPIAVANLVRHMRDPADLKEVRAQLQYSLAHAIRFADIAVNSTNGYLALLKGPAAVAELTKARDEMIAIKLAMQSLQVDAGPPPSNSR
jgi:hypothetical protein